MIATSRRSASGPAISREYEFSRFADQSLASSYEALVPVVSQRAESGPRRTDDGEVLSSVHRSPQRSAAGA
jgi:hypothetical protein